MGPTPAKISLDFQSISSHTTVGSMSQGMKNITYKVPTLLYIGIMKGKINGTVEDVKKITKTSAY